MKSKFIIRIGFICIGIVAVTFLVLKLTVWKDAPDAYQKDSKKDTKIHYGSQVNNLQKKVKRLKINIRHIQEMTGKIMRLSRLKQYGLKEAILRFS